MDVYRRLATDPTESTAPTQKGARTSETAAKETQDNDMQTTLLGLSAP